MEIILRATAVYFFVYLLLRAMGKRELGEMSAFELVLLVMIGDLVQQAVTQEDMSVTGAVLAVGTIAFWVMASSYLAFKSSRAEEVLESPPVVVVRDGVVQREALRIERVSEADLMESARKHGVDDLRKVTLAVLESDGKFSFLQRISGPTQGEEEGHRAAE
ncbi:MAG TPA: YetF domain-containing protein [Actinomycetota bacterium]